MSRPSGKKKRRGLAAGIVPALVLVLALGFAWWARQPSESQRVATPEEAAQWPIPDIEGLSPPIEQMEQEARQRLLRNPAYGPNWGHLGSVYKAHQLLEPALECFERAEALSPDDYRWSYLKATTLTEMPGRDAEALQAFERAERIAPDEPAVLFFHALELQLQGRFAEAEEKVLRVLELKPDMASAHRVHGQLLLQLDRPEEAVGALEKASELEPNDKAAWAFLAQAYQSVGRADDAAVAATKSEDAETVIGRVVDPAGATVNQLRRDPAGTSQRARALQEQGDWAGAADQWEYFLQTNPGNHAGWISLANCHIQLGNRNMAEGLLERVLLMAPNEPRIPRQLAYLRRADGDGPATVTYARQTLELKPDDPEALALLAWGLGASGRYQEALQVLQTTSTRFNLPAASHVDWANWLVAVNQPAQAAEQYRLALQKGGESGALYLALASALEAAGDEDGAAEARQEALRFPDGRPRPQ